MTEKRFTLVYGKYRDNLTNIDYDEKFESWKICELLNTLSDENEQLKEQVGKLKKENKHFRKVFSNKYDAYIEGIIGGNVNEL